MGELAHAEFVSIAAIRSKPEADVEQWQICSERSLTAINLDLYPDTDKKTRAHTEMSLRIEEKVKCCE